jgi:hypothetical protein
MVLGNDCDSLVKTTLPVESRCNRILDVGSRGQRPESQAAGVGAASGA